MLSLLVVFHLLVAFSIIFFVLIQDSRGGGLGTAYGQSGSQSLLGATGAVSFIVKLTRYAAVFFAVTSVAITLWVSTTQESVIDGFEAEKSLPVESFESTEVPGQKAPPQESTSSNPTEPPSPE